MSTNTSKSNFWASRSEFWLTTSESVIPIPIISWTSQKGELSEFLCSSTICIIFSQIWATFRRLFVRLHRMFSDDFCLLFVGWGWLSKTFPSATKGKSDFLHSLWGGVGDSDHPYDPGTKTNGTYKGRAQSVGKNAAFGPNCSYVFVEKKNKTEILFVCNKAE